METIQKSNQVGLNVIGTIKKTLPKCVEEKKIFTFDGEHIKAIAFIQGLKHRKLDELKKFLKNTGYTYDFVYECYLKNDCIGECLEKYRSEKNEFLNNLITWKVSKA